MGLHEPWTARRVREELPTVKVKCGATIIDGAVRGSQNTFASVHVVVLGADFRIEVAWETIAHCLNAGKAVIA